ncbi:MAG: ABC transporter ATP-binding protein [Apibacter sp.]|uniref:Lipoprotein-releasing system ATP-binding protein n=1 Tax=Apibacter mensalis TaxID=1586267 RepID=A0A0X3ANM2_9FLAO|nr:ABC transporter ATP-binding protein [Apibacter mensalis]MCO6565219.1 ABC transporter ATP-binding protein [Apibacter sp.]CVK15952.1 lipoprotein-releasing system ATP-binding protein [Apibacter mensalis]
MVLIQNIHKSFGSLEVLKGVSIHIKKGEIVTIVGESGAGKSTLLQIIGTLDKPSNPERYHSIIEIDNLPITQLRDKELSLFRNQNIGFIFQFHQLLPEFTALENVMLPGMIAGKSKSKLAKKAKDLLSYLKLSHRLEHKPGELSGGEQQRVSVARALMNNPKIILADEPSGNLDSTNAEDLHQLFYQLRKEFNQTFIIVTHNSHLASMADRSLLMKDGTIANE